MSSYVPLPHELKTSDHSLMCIAERSVEFSDRCAVFCFPRFSESIDRQVPVDDFTHYSIVPKVFYTCNLSAQALGDGPTPKALTVSGT